MDRQGNLYIADFRNDRIRRVSATTLIITTIAGVGIGGFDGDGALATDARLDGPSDVAVDMADNVYVIDSVNRRLRKLTLRTSN